MAMIKVGDVVSYIDMCQEEGIGALQRGMNYPLG
jgi:hypothetical protein|tara:strand:- start:4969 stop:5070 length:102 start_codon:yes stop_codon:yes gene_type:complete